MSHAAFPSESPANHHPQHASSSGGGGGAAGGAAGGGAGGAGAGLLPFYHVPQQSRREKLRYPTCTGDVVVDPLFMAITPSSSSSTPTAFLLHNSSSATTSSANHPNPNPHYDQPSTTFHNYVNSSQAQFELAADTPLHGHYGGPLFPPNHQHHHRQPASLSLVPAPQPSVCRGPAEPFTGYAAVLRGSRFLRPAQLLLEEICDAGLSRAAPLLACASSIGDPEGDLGIGGGDCGERRRTKTRLISMLDEVCRRYKQYCQQIQDVINSFESVAGLSNAAPYTSLALNSMTKHFRSLKGAISDQLRFADTATGLGKEGHSKDEFSRFGLLNSSGICYPGGAAAAAAASARTSAGSMIQPPPNVWRPQRGLPERAVAVLKAWLFEHFLHPYPTDADKHMLARQTGLSRNQVSNWFINARVRLWKPLVEEIHALEVRQARKAPDQSDCSNRGTSTGGGGGGGAGAGAQQSSDVASTSTNHQSNDQQPPLREEAIVGLGKNQMNSHPQRIRNNDPFAAETPNQMEQPPPPVRFSFDDFSGRVGGGGGGSIPSSGGVSLTLGLNQNHVGVCLPEPLPFNVARRFGLEDATTSSPYPPIGGLHHQMQQEQDRQQQFLGKDIDGQLLRDFGG